VRSSIAREAYNPELDQEKLEQSILFFLHVANIAYLGKTKLMKLLYFADFDHYEQYDIPITGARYRKLEHGPVPDDAMIVVEELERAGRVRRTDIVAEGFTQHRYEPNEPVNLAAFSPTELDVLHQVAQRWAPHTTKQIEAATHGEAPWLAVRRNEIIPYHLAYYRNNFGAMDLHDDEQAEGEVVPDEDAIFAR
jgi:uncharacterized phage-associated protein